MAEHEKQKEYFTKINKILDRKGYLLNVNDNLLVPFESEDDEDWNAFVEGDGNELHAKMMAAHSSSALCLNFFRYWKRNNKNIIIEMLIQELFGKISYDSEKAQILFEEKHYFGKNEKDKLRGNGIPGNVDVEISDKENFIILIESKFTEIFQDGSNMSEVNAEIYGKIFSKYFINIDDILEGTKRKKYYQLAQRMLYILNNSKDEIDRIPDENKKFMFLYFDNDNENLDFGSLIKDEYRKYYKKMSYQELYEKMRSKPEDVKRKYEEWYHYMGQRYFK